MKNKNKTVWGTRFNNATSKVFEKIGASIDIDKRLFEEDVLGCSILTAKISKFLKLLFWKRLSKDGISFLHGAHHVAQKLIITSFPI